MGSSMSTTTPSSESIPDDALAEILLRVPPHPNCLARASLAGKGPRRVTTSPDFHRTFRKRHNSAPPPLLGFFHDDGDLPSNFLPVGDSPDRVSAAAFDPMEEEPGWRVVDSRHGRVLLRSPDRLRFLVWEPMAGRRSYVDVPPPDHAEHYKFSSAALVCTAAHEEEGHHIDCHDCPLSILFVRNVAYWTMAGAMGIQEGILAFELESQRLYQIGQPAYIFDAEHEHVQVMEEEGGRLGLVVACGLTLQLWVLLEYNGEGTERWEMQGEVYLDDDLFSGEPMFEDYYLLWILGMDGSLVFLRTEVGIFEVDLLTEQSKRLWDGHEIEALYPYRSFYRQGIAQFSFFASVIHSSPACLASDYSVHTLCIR
ncbi:unnamed protein product [Urochloa decumbens]|uniref:F-box protein n=1 Tax=Urochloa decumbens TaxID=240449 RepID=A0ABC8YFF3_9POAL